MSVQRGAFALLAVGFILALPWASVRVGAASDRTTIFALDRSYYPPHVYLGAYVPTDHEADHLVGNVHYTTFAGLGRNPTHGWLQGAVWEPKFVVTHLDGSRHRDSRVITTAYLVSEYDSAEAAHAAVLDMYVTHYHWAHLAEGQDGQILVVKQDGYTMIAAAFSEGVYDVEDISVVSPDTPRRLYRTIKAAVLSQMGALDKIAAGIDSPSGSN